MRLSHYEARVLDGQLLERARRKIARAKIERAYQRAMDIRDSTPCYGKFSEDERTENAYMHAYMRAYRSGRWQGFTAVTRRYLKTIRATASKPAVEEE